MKTIRKIDIYLRPFQTRIWVYECSTTTSKTLKEAKARFCAMHGLDHSQVKVCFSDKEK
jgi:hypothetical protein